MNSDDEWLALAEDVGMTALKAFCACLVFAFVVGFIAGALIT